LTNSVEGLDLTFTVALKDSPNLMVELKPDGANTSVTEENKSEYVKLYVSNYLTGSIRKQLQAFISGFYLVIPREQMPKLTEKELELLLCGVPDINVDDWRKNTKYDGFTEQDEIIEWFWRIVTDMTMEDRAKLLQFCYGSAIVPAGGFANFKHKFNISKQSNTKLLPQSHTCGFQLDLPKYESEEDLKIKLYRAITLVDEGFGFG